MEATNEMALKQTDMGNCVDKSALRHVVQMIKMDGMHLHRDAVLVPDCLFWEISDRKIPPTPHPQQASCN